MNRNRASDLNIMSNKMLHSKYMEERRMDIEKVKAYNCPIEAAMGVIGGK